MLGKVKDFLGIEGLRLDLELRSEFERSSGLLLGNLVLTTLRPQRIVQLSLKLEERYSRGRGERKLISTYVLGEYTDHHTIELAQNEQLVVPFELRFAERRSKIDQAVNDNRLLSPLRYLAMKSVAAKSEFSLQAQASVQGVKLTPTTSLAL